jgi:hypothetical protein
MFSIVVAAADKAFGFMLDYMRDNAKGGQVYEQNYVYNEVTPDILVLGSSRAYHHYVPKIIEDSLHMTCFNAGYDACTIIPMYCRFLKIAERKAPKLVIYDIYSNNDLLINQNVDNVNILRMYYDNSIISDVYKDIIPEDRLKLLSSLYRYNSKINSILKSFVVPTQIANNGYSPFFAEMRREPLSIDRHTNMIDIIKVKYIEKLIKQCQQSDIRLVFTISPWYKDQDESEYGVLYDLSKKYGVPVISHLKDSIIINDRSLFKDQAHLNDKGARKFTSLLTRDLKKYVN